MVRELSSHGGGFPPATVAIAPATHFPSFSLPLPFPIPSPTKLTAPTWNLARNTFHSIAQLSSRSSSSDNLTDATSLYISALVAWTVAGGDYPFRLMILHFVSKALALGVLHPPARPSFPDENCRGPLGTVRSIQDRCKAEHIRHILRLLCASRLLNPTRNNSFRDAG